MALNNDFRFLLLFSFLSLPKGGYRGKAVLPKLEVQPIKNEVLVSSEFWKRFKTTAKTKSYTNRNFVYSRRIPKAIKLGNADDIPPGV